jgi:hypothetical protein
MCEPKRSFVNWKTLDVNAINFEPPFQIPIPDPKIKAYRIPITYGPTKMKLSVSLPKLFSWGIQENRNIKKSDKPTGQQNNPSDDTNPIESYTFGLVMYDDQKMPEPELTLEEKNTMDMLKKIDELAKEYLLSDEVKKAIGRYNEVYVASVKCLTIFTIRKKDGIPIPNKAPGLYPKLLTVFEQNRNPLIPPKIKSRFYDMKDNQLNAHNLIGVRCMAMCEVTIDNIYVGVQPSFQLKLNDVIICNTFTSPRNLFPPPVEKDSNDMLKNDDSDDDENNAPIVRKHTLP